VVIAWSILFAPRKTGDNAVTASVRDEGAENLDAAAQEFLLWALRALGLHLHVTSDGVHEIQIPSESQEASAQAHPYAALQGRRFVLEAASSPAAATDAPEHLTWHSPLVLWLLNELGDNLRPLHAAPAHQPLSVHELAEHLFAQYRVDGGHMHLAGCSLEDRPFLRLSCLRRPAEEDAAQVVHGYGTPEGVLLSSELRNSLELQELMPLVGRSTHIDADVLRRWAALTRQQLEGQMGSAELTPIAITLVWCKYAEGKIAFCVDHRSVEVTFSGWARLLADRRCLPPPYHCPLTGRSSYHLAATDDGRITVAEAIATCAVSSRRVLDDELVECSVTGKRVLPEYAGICPCTGEWVLTSAFEQCEMCRQPVSPRAIVGGLCTACRQLRSVSSSDPELARILDTYPQLDRLRNWRMAETQTAQIVVGRFTWKRLLVVLDKQSLEVLHAARGNWLTTSWTPLTGVQRDEWLGTGAGP
jgi:hypothetical protein